MINDPATLFVKADADEELVYSITKNAVRQSRPTRRDSTRRPVRLRLKVQPTRRSTCIRAPSATSTKLASK